MDIRVLAEREKTAEADRKTAEDTWRQTWWETTMALGAISDEAERAAAVATVEVITGKSRGWIQSRARTGERFAEISMRNVVKLPPRMAVELVRTKVPITKKVVKDLLKADQDGMSLREFSRRLTGKGWADTPAGASKETLEQIVAEQPELVGKLVAQHHQASIAHDSEVLDRHRHQGIELSPATYTKPADWNSTEHALTTLTLAVKRVRMATDQPGDLTENARATIEWALAELTAIKEGQDFVGEVESWLEGNTV